jgi:hypothetical protein
VRNWRRPRRDGGHPVDDANHIGAALGTEIAVDGDAERTPVLNILVLQPKLTLVPDR